MSVRDKLDLEIDSDGYTSVVVKVEKHGREYQAFDPYGNEFTDEIPSSTRSKAYDNGEALNLYITKTDREQWRRVSMSKFNSLLSEAKEDRAEEAGKLTEDKYTHEDIVEFIHNSYDLKPEGLKMKEPKWKYLIRSVIRGRNIMMTGMAGCGKTLAAQAVADVFDGRDFFTFNLGATQDPRATLIGNTHFDSDQGTFHKESLFVQAIRTPNAIILLDELSRAHPEAWNILMSVLDYSQRYLRLDESVDSETVHVAEGVTFIATANIGVEYTSTRVLDRALVDRFVIVEMDTLSSEEEDDLLQYMFPQVDEDLTKAVAEIASHTRDQLVSGDSKLNTAISTRTSVEVTGLLHDGFTLTEAAEVAVYPLFDNSGLDDARTYVRQYVQKYVKDDSTPDSLFGNVRNSVS